MKKLLSLLIALLLAFGPLAAAGYAAAVSSVSASIDQKTRMVTVAGHIDAGSGRQVSLKVVGPDGKTENYVGQTTSGDNGSFAFAFKLAGNIKGKYAVKASGEFVPSAVTTTFEYTGGDEARPSPSPTPAPTAPPSWTSRLLEKDAGGEWQYNTLNLSDKEWNVGKYDFSYAGYKYNDAAFGTGVPDEVVTISAKQGEDITDKLNTAIRQMDGGGTVQIPAGEYRIGTKPPDPPVKPSIVVDNTDPGFSASGTWTESNYGGTGFVGSNYLHDGSDSPSDKSAVWTPDISEAGNYNIYMWWNASGNRTDAAPLEIKHSEGVDSSKTVNQKVNGSKWVLIGTYELSVGTDNYVKILASAPGYTIADAVKFEPVYTPSVAPRVIVDKDNVVIRGAADGATKLVVDGSYSSNDDFAKGAIQFGTGFSWKDATSANTAPFTYATSDILTGSTTFTVADSTGFKVGDFINIRQKQWPEFNQRNFGGLTELLTNNTFAFHYLRKITAISGKTITVDIPVAYDLKPDNNMIDVYKVDSYFIKNVGLEDLTIDVEANGVIETDPDTGAETKNTNTGTAVMFVGVWDAWARNVTVNHINTIGFGAVYSSGITFDNCSVNWGRNRGGGGTGYAFYIKAQNLLYRNCLAYEVRHGYTTAAPVSNDIVIKDSISKDLGFYPTYQGEAVDDTHIAFTHAILWDNHYGDASGIFMIYRGTLSDYAYETNGWGIVWNYYNTGRDPNNWSQGTLKLSPADYAYVVAPHGNVTVVDGFERSPSVDGQVETDPGLHVGEYDNKTLYEGVGWDHLSPESLYTIMYFKRHHIISPSVAPTVANVSDTSAKISWGAVSGADRYDVYRSTDGNSFARLGSTTETSFEDSGLKADTPYYYAFAPVYLYEVGEKSPAAPLNEEAGPTPTPTPTLTPTPTTPTPTPATPTPTTSTPTPTPTPTSSASASVVIVEASTDASGAATANVTSDALEQALQSAPDGVVKIEVKASPTSDKVIVNLPAQQVRAAGSEGLTEIVIDAGLATVAFDPDVFNGNVAAAANHIQLTVAKVDPSGLAADIRDKVGSSAVYDFNLSVDGQPIGKFGGGHPVTVKIPYTLKSGENPDKVVVYTISDSGKLEVVKNGMYDPATGMATFSPKHFSSYFAHYVPVSFADLDAAQWARAAVEALAAREIVDGLGDGTFHPTVGVTRAQFLKMLIGALELEDDQASSSMKDVREGDWYYAYVAAAEKLGIVNGREDGTFGPGDPASRQDIAVMLYRALGVASIAVPASSGGTPLPFADGKEIAGYARDAITALHNAEILEGFEDGRFAPGEHATRAQAAAIIFRILSAVHH